MKKLSSYQKLKQKNEELWEMYVKVVKKLRKLNQGIDSDCYLIGGEEKL